MGGDSCPYCKEEIKANAIICKHCHSSLLRTREEMAISAIVARLSPAVAVPTSASPCKALCYSKFGGKPSARLNECLNDCEAVEAAALVAERLNRELLGTFIDVIWGGGDIDPKPLEKAVRERFSRRRVRG